jgi:predicted glutamine amidotransferase
MCRFIAYLGPPLALSHLIYKPDNSLVRQASNAMRSRERINADGFGVAWYSTDDFMPAVFKDTSPVWNNRNLSSIAGKIRSGCIAAHIRKAARFDPVTRENCHPFDRGRILWMHNGDIPGRARLTRNVAAVADDLLLAQIKGNTDSEMALTLFLTFLEKPLERPPSRDELSAAMSRTVRQILDWHREAGEERALELNFCVTEGSCLVATRFAVGAELAPSLHWYLGPDSGSFAGPAAGDRTPGDSECAVIASEPLSGDGPWKELDNGEMIVVSRDLSPEIQPVLSEAVPIAG